MAPPPSSRIPSWPNDRLLYCRLNRYRRIATRYDMLDVVFLSFVQLALIYDALNSA